ncbi:anti-sigma factor [Streptomyces sp. NPDC047108]|uniref:anti-sigma factor n=1 Tax=Streptomyces sp. NPDC047108 TaxID=3155025 RepID=UPI0033F7F134
MSTHDHTLTGAYALDALTPEEREEFERHLEECPACAQEVRELRATAAQLGLASAVPVPARMRDEVLRRIGTTPQEEAPHEPRDQRQGPPQEPQQGPPGRHAATVRRRQRRLPRMMLAACVALAAAFGGIGVWQYQEAEHARQEAQRTAQRNDEVAAVVTSPDAVSVSQSIGDGARGTVVSSRDVGRAVFFAAGLPGLSDGKVYQLWYDQAGTFRSAGLVPAGGDAETVLAGRIGGASGMAITVEPAGGSSQPTTRPLAQFTLA